MRDGLVISLLSIDPKRPTARFMGQAIRRGHVIGHAPDGASE